MAAANTDKFRKKRSNFNTTLNGDINDSVTTISLNSTTGLPTDTAITLTIDRVDADEVETPALQERVTGVVSGNDLTNCLRGEGNTSALSHNSGAQVEDVWDAETWNDLMDALLTEHAQDGTHGDITADSITVTPIDIGDGGVIRDDNNNELMEFNEIASAVNHVLIQNAATTNAPLISPAGETNVDLELAGKGTGKVKVDSSYGDWVTESDGATVTFNLKDSNKQRVTLEGNRTLALSNAAVGQVFMIKLIQDGTGSRTVTWWGTINWTDGDTEPTLTTTADRADVFGFVCTSSGKYDGFIVGQDLTTA